MIEVKNIPLTVGLKRRESGNAFEEIAKTVLSGYGFTKILDAGEEDPYDLIALDRENSRSVIEVKGVSNSRSVDETWFSIQYEKLWNLLKHSDRNKVYFLFLTKTDSKIVPFDELIEKEYIDSHRIKITIKKGGPLWHRILTSRLKEIAQRGAPNV